MGLRRLSVIDWLVLGFMIRILIGAMLFDCVYVEHDAEET